VQIEIINTGSELLLGRVLNTHQQWLCRRLADLGYVVGRQCAVPDTAAAIEEAVRDALSRADLVITTGGLGPTADDVTRDRIAGLLGKALREDPDVLAAIQNYFVSRKRPLPPHGSSQAQVPEGAIVLPNANGTAPGLVMEIRPNTFRAAGQASWLVMLPGPPRELYPMFADQVAPFLRRQFPLAGAFVCRTLKTTGLGESWVEEKIAGPLQPLIAAGLDVGYCARVGEVDVRLSARGPKAGTLVDEGDGIVRKCIGKFVFGLDDDSLEAVVVRLLAERRQSLAVAESCTGGFIANRLTNVPGASTVFWGGLVTYDNEAKQKLLGVRAQTLEDNGAVSKPVAREMAEGARRHCGVDLAVAVTGIAGPGGGTETKPVGTVFLALASARRCVVSPHVNRYDRETFKYVTSQQALELVRRRLLKR